MKKSLRKKVLFACDHGGFALKNFLVQEIEKLGLEVVDLGTDSAQSVDYPDYAQKLCKKLKEDEFGVLICGSGVGISIAANRFKNIRAALCTNPKTAKLSRAHNDANVLCLGARLISQRTALSCLKAFLSTEFEKGRHEGRVQKLSC